MDFIRELLEAAKKKTKVTKTAASSVYHRDYVKTKKKPYRKYDPNKHARLSEDFEQQDQSQQAQAQQSGGSDELAQHLKQLVVLLAKYDQLKETKPQQQSAPSFQFSSFMQSASNSLMEDKWKFNERPPQEGPGGPSAVSAPAANNPNVKPEEPSEDDLASVKQSASQHIRAIIDLVKDAGQNAEQQLAQAVSQNCGNKARRVMVVLQQAANKMGVQL